MTENGADEDEIDWNARLRFVVSIMVWHPSLDPAVLTEALGRTPFRCWQAGTLRSTMRGDPLPGRWPDSYWVARRRAEGRRDFFAAAGEEMTALEACAGLVGRILADGGKVNLKLSLPGENNIGDVMPAAMLMRLGALGVGLDVEVFPDMA